MPELPEVETVRQGLLPAMEGHRFTKVVTRRGDLRRPFPKDFATRLTGRRVLRLARRAKYILAELDNGEDLVIHLGMSGRMSVSADADGAPGKHDHVVMETDAPARIIFTDHRRFGLMTLLPHDGLDSDPLFKGLGPEPLSPAFDAAFLKKALAGKRTPIKSALLDQRLIAGLGNIYVCEALYRAGISPKKLAGSVSAKAITPLARAIKAVLEDAIKAGGSSLRDHKQVNGELGYFQHRFRVYDREGTPCPRCKTPIKRIVQAGRSSFYCPKCQR
ncbi:MAG: bifunctional DNA-formamidopyrimidine glycosylase/DNA-(apurinic or apyrimidinic site) lyase [Alphaproteobacteria bacterium]|nr:bifunctional DNA-formamidopyrimidine glycosylase/DNA-(apurinic or apyrimidinic site) lyase [Alphaproteobacteria bacterium]MBN9592973.1 bifunctional DNA-formamidopyrimidine glycosylase/DNA-(apurinic or apyrimidinic site) lyase [Alphaproteobacteria bacterium]